MDLGPHDHADRADQADDALTSLTRREREVLALMASGRTDRGIGDELFITRKTVEAHVRSIFRKLSVPGNAAENRRVHAVLTFLGVESTVPAYTIAPAPPPKARPDAPRGRTGRSPRRGPGG